VVEDEAIAAEAHGAYLGRIPGFELAGTARSGTDALRILRADAGVDLVLLDMHLPDVHGLDLLRRIRVEGSNADVIAVTSARDLEVVQRAVSQGVVQYLLKPFTFAAFKTKLEQYAAYRERLAASHHEVVQDEVDALFGSLRSAAGANALPKGMSPETLRLITDLLRDATEALSASEVAATAGASRVTARRYLEHLADSGLAVRQQRYGGSGRPEVEYRWSGGR
jgi:response regulator of citrate/malate metabolism